MLVHSPVWVLLLAPVASGTKFADDKTAIELKNFVEAETVKVRNIVEKFYADLQTAGSGDSGTGACKYVDSCCCDNPSKPAEATCAARSSGNCCSQGDICKDITEGPWKGKNRAKSQVSVLHTPERDIDDKKNRNVQCLANPMGRYFMTFIEEYYDDDMRFGEMLYGDQASGALVLWPGDGQWCSSTGGYDPRGRPWYAGATTGPKDLVIVVDVSGSMLEQGRGDLVRGAIYKVLNTVGENDWLTIVAFSGVVETYKYEDRLWPMTDKNLERMKAWVDSLTTSGGKDFHIAFEATFKVLTESRAKGFTSSCSTSILFISDGQSSIDLAWLKQLNSGIKAHIFTYSLGADAMANGPKAIACQNQGVWYPIPDGGKLGDAMAGYYQILATAVDDDAARWTNYTSFTTGLTLTEVTMAIKDRTKSPPTLLGVAGIAINTVISLKDLMKKTDFEEMKAKMKSEMKACGFKELLSTDLQMIRSAQGSSAVCNSDDISRKKVTLAEVQATPAPTPAYQPSPSPEEVSGASVVTISLCTWSLIVVFNGM